MIAWFFPALCSYLCPEGREISTIELATYCCLLALIQRDHRVLIDQGRHAVVAGERAVFRRGRQREHVHALLVAAIHQEALNAVVDPKPDLLLDALERRDHHWLGLQVVPLTGIEAFR